MINEEQFKIICRSYKADCKFDTVKEKGKYPTLYTFINCKNDIAMLCHLDCCVVAEDRKGKRYPMVYEEQLVNFFKKNYIG